MRAVVLTIVVTFSLFIGTAGAQEYTHITDEDIALFPNLITSPTCVKGCSITSPAEDEMVLIIKPMPIENGLAEYYWIVKAGGRCHPKYGCPGLLFANHQGRWLPKTSKFGTTEDLVKSWIVDSEAELAQLGTQSPPSEAKTAEPGATASDESRSLECSRRADAQGVQGVERRDFQMQCKGSNGANSSSGASLSYVANTEPPDAYLALRTDPVSSRGRRVMTMPNGTLLEVLKRQPDGWWYVRVVPTGQTGWALSATRDRRWIECCKTALLAGDTSAAAAETLTPAGRPSFNCANAKSASARLICSDTELSKADATLGAQFKDVMIGKDEAAKRQIVSQQLLWLRERNARCGVGPDKAGVPVDQLADSKRCMLEAITARTGELATSATLRGAAQAPAAEAVQSQPESDCNSQDTFDRIRTGSIPGMGKYLELCPDGRYAGKVKSTLEGQLFDSAIGCIRQACTYNHCLTSYTNYFPNGNRLQVLRTAGEIQRQSTGCGGKGVSSGGAW